MEKEILVETVSRLMRIPKGILAIDESVETIEKRFTDIGIFSEAEIRREYRELLITTPGIEKYISGFILHEETLGQSDKNGKSFVSILESKGIDVGIKVDEGLLPLKENSLEKITNGIKDLRERLSEYKKAGATFAKWRAVYLIGENTPTEECMKENAVLLAQYASLCQEFDIVPIIEPEILMDGDHDINKDYEITARNLDIVFSELIKREVFIPGVVLKINMILPGKDKKEKAGTRKIAEMTLKCLKEHVPSYIGGIVFLSGGQDDREATINLNEMHKMGPLPWTLTFSYSRAIQNKVMKFWSENMEDIISSQKILLDVSRENSLASVGEFK